MSRTTPSTRPAGITEPAHTRIIAGLVDETVDRVADLYTRGRADEIAAELRETHLPALEEAGYIEWDRETGSIRPGPNFDEAADHVSDLPDPEAKPADD